MVTSLSLRPLKCPTLFDRRRWARRPKIAAFFLAAFGLLPVAADATLGEQIVCIYSSWNKIQKPAENEPLANPRLPLPHALGDFLLRPAAGFAIDVGAV
jgi:hypothetical protein